MDPTLALGNPDPDLTGVVFPARVHLRGISYGKYPLTTIVGSPALLIKENDHEQKKENGRLWKIPSE